MQRWLDALEVLLVDQLQHEEHAATHALFGIV
jgi:hypothetical protein